VVFGRRQGADEETLVPGAVVSKVARRHGLSPEQLFTWGRQARQPAAANAATEAPQFVPAIVESVLSEGAAHRRRQRQRGLPMDRAGLRNHRGGDRGRQRPGRPWRGRKEGRGNHPGAEPPGLVRREPHDATRLTATVALGWLPECTCKLPFLGFIAPLNSGVAENIV
jgi:transposase-like protein